MANGKLEFKSTGEDGDVGYLSMPVHPGIGTPAIVAKQIRLSDVYGAYDGPDIYLDFDKDGRLLGIEIV